MIKFILNLIKWLIELGIVLFVILFPIILYHQNPFVFYWDKINLLVDGLKALFTIGNFKALF